MEINQINQSINPVLFKAPKSSVDRILYKCLAFVFPQRQVDKCAFEKDE